MDVHSSAAPEVDVLLERPRIVPKPLVVPAERDGAVIHDAPTFGEVAQRERVYRRNLAIADVLASAASLLLVTTAAGHAPRWGLFLLVPAVVLISKLMGLY